MKSPSRARLLAHTVLLRVSSGHGKPDSLLHSRLASGLSRPDRNLATELVYGVLRSRGLLDYLIAAHARRPAADIDPPLLEALRLGVYQLRFLTRVPARAAVDESVELARASGGRGAGFVNAVLRSVTRRPEEPSLPTRDSALDYLTISLSHPLWLAERYLDRLGFSGAEALCLYNNREPPTYLRIDPRFPWELEAEDIETEEVPGVPGARRLISGELRDSGAYRSGHVYVQDAGSQLVATLVAPSPGDVVLDACAAPGSKTTAIAAAHPRARIIAMENHPRRVRTLAAVIKRAVLSNARPLRADVLAAPFDRTFPWVLLDAPCSGLGTLARNPDIRWRVQESDLERFAERERALLEACAGLTSPGGNLVYATCSTEPEENEDVVSSFLERYAGFERLKTLQTHPGRDRMDGYFAVVLKRPVS